MKKLLRIVATGSTRIVATSGARSVATAGKRLVTTVATRIATMVSVCLIAAITLGATFASPAAALDASVTSLNLGKTKFAMSTKAQAISLTEDFAYDLTVTPAKNVVDITVQFDLNREDGTLLYRRTRYIKVEQPKSSATTTDASTKKKKAKTPKPINETFGRSLDGLAMTAGIYPVTVQVTVNTGNDRSTASLRDYLTVYDPAAPALSVIPIVTVASEPHRNTAGQFVVDPSADSELAIVDSLLSLARWVKEDSNARVNLSISPLTLSDYGAAAAGYVLFDKTKPISIPENSPVSKQYATLLAELNGAARSGRLTLGAAGYADPDFAALKDSGRNQDIEVQYEFGAETLLQILDSTPSAWSVPAGLTIDSSQIEYLEKRGVTHLLIRDGISRNAKRRLMVVGDNMTAMVAQSSLSEDIAQTNEGQWIATFGQKQGTKYPLPFIVSLNGSREVQRTKVKNLRALSGQKWLTIADPTSVSAAGTRIETLTIPASTQAPAAKKRLEQVTDARRRADCLREIMADDAPLATKVILQSLTAQCGSSVVNEHVAMRDELIDANTKSVRKATNKVFKNISIKASSITLSSSSGTLPITITNANEDELSATLRLETSEHITFPDGDSVPVTLPAQDTFVEPNLTLANVLSGTITIEVLGGDYTIASEKVSVTASYLDQVVMAGVVILIGLGLIIFIWRKVVSSPEIDDVDGGEAEYSSGKDSELPAVVESQETTFTAPTEVQVLPKKLASPADEGAGLIELDDVLERLKEEHNEQTD